MLRRRLQNPEDDRIMLIPSMKKMVGSKRAPNSTEENSGKVGKRGYFHPFTDSYNEAAYDAV